MPLIKFDAVLSRTWINKEKFWNKSNRVFQLQWQCSTNFDRDLIKIILHLTDVGEDTFGDSSKLWNFIDISNPLENLDHLNTLIPHRPLSPLDSMDPRTPWTPWTGENRSSAMEDLLHITEWSFWYSLFGFQTTSWQNTYFDWQSLYQRLVVRLIAILDCRV